MSKVTSSTAKTSSNFLTIRLICKKGPTPGAPVSACAFKLVATTISLRQLGQLGQSKLCIKSIGAEAITLTRRKKARYRYRSRLFMP
jgi:hypothetical protein